MLVSKKIADINKEIIKLETMLQGENKKQLNAVIHHDQSGNATGFLVRCIKSMPHTKNEPCIEFIMQVPERITNEDANTHISEQYTSIMSLIRNSDVEIASNVRPLSKDKFMDIFTEYDQHDCEISCMFNTNLESTSEISISIGQLYMIDRS